MCFIIFYEASGILVRVFGPGLFSKRLYTSVRHMCYVNPIFTIVLPIYSILILKYYRSNRDSNIRSVVMMESRGAAGTRNYEEAIGKAWQFNQQP
uniref:G_PROTEIN_RECEP_F1_2 domain-containing protein n=1 Tax=Angiostrongylus cantonensis TaxID=6313 RepID=A0A0K0DIA0_ANGCA